MYVAQIGGGAVLVAGLVLVAAVRRYPLCISVDADQADAAAKPLFGLADGRNDGFNAIRMEQINYGIGHRDRQSLQAVALLVNPQTALEEVATFQRKDDHTASFLGPVASPVDLRG